MTGVRLPLLSMYRCVKCIPLSTPIPMIIGIVIMLKKLIFKPVKTITIKVKDSPIESGIREKRALLKDRMINKTQRMMSVAANIIMFLPSFITIVNNSEKTIEEFAA